MAAESQAIIARLLCAAGCEDADNNTKTSATTDATGETVCDGRCEAAVKRLLDRLFDPSCAARAVLGAGRWQPEVGPPMSTNADPSYTCCCVGLQEELDSLAHSGAVERSLEGLAGLDDVRSIGAGGEQARQVGYEGKLQSTQAVRERCFWQPTVKGAGSLVALAHQWVDEQRQRWKQQQALIPAPPGDTEAQLMAQFVGAVETVRRFLLADSAKGLLLPPRDKTLTKWQTAR